MATNCRLMTRGHGRRIVAYGLDDGLGGHQLSPTLLYDVRTHSVVHDGTKATVPRYYDVLLDRVC